MFWFALGQLWFALRGKFDNGTGKIVVSKDGLFKRLKMALRLLFVEEVFAAFVRGTGGKIAEVIVNEKLEADRKADLEKKAQRKRSMRSRR